MLKATLFLLLNNINDTTTWERRRRSGLGRDGSQSYRLALLTEFCHMLHDSDGVLAIGKDMRSPHGRKFDSACCLWASCPSWCLSTEVPGL